jgi:hypothetical protein
MLTNISCNAKFRESLEPLSDLEWRLIHERDARKIDPALWKLNTSEPLSDLEWRLIHERDASKIDPALWKLNTTYLDGDAAIGRFLASIDTTSFTGRTQIDAQWRSLRKRHQIQAIAAGTLFFESIDPQTGCLLDWVRGKPQQPRRDHKNPNKVIKYETPPKQPLRVSFFRVTLEVWQAIADRYHIPMPEQVMIADDGAAIGFWPWVLEHPEITLVITEGEKKALSLLSAGFAAVSVPGINCGYRCIKDSSGNVIDRRLHPDLLPFANRRVVLAYDQDTKPSTRTKVEGAIARTARLLLEAGALPCVAQWSGQQSKGIDDLIAAGGDVDTTIAQAQTPTSLDLHFARKRVANRLGDYQPDLKVNVADLSAAIAPESVPQTGIVVIIGNTGTAKTKLIERLVESVKAAIAPGFRIGLQRGLSQRIGLTYIKDCDRAANYFIDTDGQPTLRVSLVWDSILSVPMYMYPNGTYDLVLDEADQGFLHLISGGTCGKDGKRPALTQRALDLIKGARRIILASATITRHELDLVAAVRQERPWILQNTYQANGYPITLYSGQRGVTGSSTRAKAAVIEEIVQSITVDERVIVACDQRQTTKMIAGLGTKLGLLPHQVMRFDRETSSGDWQRQFAENPDAFLAEHDIRLLVHSPSLTSGISIESDYFDRVFGIFEGQTISPDDALQALARVRCPVPRIVYASHYGKGSTIDAMRKADYLRLSDRRAQLIACTTGRTIASHIDDPIANYHAATQADRNADMAVFSASLQARLEAAGCSITIQTSPNSTPELSIAISLWKDMRKQILMDDTVAQHSAAIINQASANERRNKNYLNHDEALELARYDLCEFYAIDPQALTLDDIEFDRRGQTRREISRLEGLLWDGLSRAKDTAEFDRLNEHNAPIQHHDLPDRELFSKTAIRLGVLDLLQHCLESDGWEADTEWIQSFATQLRQYADDVKLALGFRIHAKMTNCQIVGMVLNAFGFKTISRNLGSDGQRHRMYWLDRESLDRLRDILQRRAKFHEKDSLRPRTHRVIQVLLAGMNVSFTPPKNLEETGLDRADPVSIRQH